MLGITLDVLLALIVLSVPIAAVLGVLPLTLDEIYSPMPLFLALGDVAWENSIEFLLIAIPLFVLMGEILLRSGIAERMYAAMVQWLSWLSGGLMHSNIGSCALFAATSGSSVATAATIGTVALPEVGKHRYNERLFVGTLAAGGTLGILIPPSINLIIYGLLTDTSVPQLYLAGFLPGLLLALLFMATVIVACLFRRSWGGTPVETSWRRRIDSLPHLLPPLGIFLVRRGLDLCRPGDAHGSRLARRRRLADPRRRQPLAQFPDTAAGHRGRHAHDGHGDADHRGGDPPQRHAGRRRPDPGALRLHHQPRPGPCWR